VSARVRVAAIGGVSELAFESAVGGFGGSFEPVWAGAPHPAPHTSPATINLHAVIRRCLQSIVLLERGNVSLGSLESSTASEYACR
jgi:hypothetical protein